MKKYFEFKKNIKKFKNKSKNERTAEEHASVRKSCYQIQKIRSLNPALRLLVDENLMETNLMKKIKTNVDSIENILDNLKIVIKDKKEKKEKKKQKQKIKKSESSDKFKLMIINRERCLKCNDKHAPYLKFCRWSERKEINRMKNNVVLDCSFKVDECIKPLLLKKINELDTKSKKEDINQMKDKNEKKVVKNMEKVGNYEQEESDRYELREGNSKQEFDQNVANKGHKCHHENRCIEDNEESLINNPENNNFQFSSPYYKGIGTSELSTWGKYTLIKDSENSRRSFKQDTIIEMNLYESRDNLKYDYEKRFNKDDQEIPKEVSENCQFEVSHGNYQGFEKSLIKSQENCSNFEDNNNSRFCDKQDTIIDMDYYESREALIFPNDDRFHKNKQESPRKNSEDCHFQLPAEFYHGFRKSQRKNLTKCSLSVDNENPRKSHKQDSIIEMNYYDSRESQKCHNADRFYNDNQERLTKHHENYNFILPNEYYQGYGGNQVEKCSITIENETPRSCIKQDNMIERNDIMNKEKTSVLYILRNIPSLSGFILFLSRLPCVLSSDSEMNNTNLHLDYILVVFYGTCFIVILIASMVMLYYAFECACCKKNTGPNHDAEMAMVDSIPLEDMMESQPLLISPSTLDIHNELSTMTDSGVLTKNDLEAVCTDTDSTEISPTSPPHPEIKQFNYHENSILLGLEKIANCDHQAVFVKFDKSTNVDTAYVLNKSLQMSHQIEKKDIERYLYHTENCQSNPIQRNIGKGRKTEQKTKVTSMKLKEDIDTKCSLISIVLSLFNMVSFKSSMHLMSKEMKLCSIGSCEFCLVFSLFSRYNKAKRTINPIELEGLDVYTRADETSIDITYGKLLKSLEDSIKSNHPNSVDIWKYLFTNTVTVENHKNCSFKPDIKNNMIENFSNSCNNENGINNLCICGDIYTSDVHWTNENVEKEFLVIYEKNPKETKLKADFDIDDIQLRMSSFINYTDNHFTCCLPIFSEEQIYLLETKVETKKLDKQNTPVLSFYECISNEDIAFEFIGRSYGEKQLLKVRSAEYQEERKNRNVLVQKKYHDKAKLDPEKKAQKLKVKKQYDDKAKLDPEKKAQKLKVKKQYDDKAKLDPEKKAKKLKVQKKYDDKAKLDPAKKENEHLIFNQTKKEIKNNIGLTIACLICNKLKCPDSVKTYKSIDLVPLNLRVLMSVSDDPPSACYYCRHLLRKGKVPETNEIKNIVMENRFVNNQKLNYLTNIVMEMLQEKITIFGNQRSQYWKEPSAKQNFALFLSNLDAADSINIQELTKEYKLKQKLEYALGFLSCRELIKILIKAGKDKILKRGKISEEGSIILAKFYFDQLFQYEKDSMLEQNRHLSLKMTFANTDILKMLADELEDYINVCQTVVKQVYDETNDNIQTMQEGMFALKSGSKLVNHLLKLVIPFQRLIHLPRGYSYKIKGPSILVPSSVTKTISQLLPQPISDVLIPVALKRRLKYESEYIFEHINTEHVINMFKSLKFTFKNSHYKDIVFSQNLLKNDIQDFVENCKTSSRNVLKTDDTRNLEEESSSTDDEVDIEVNEESDEEILKEKDLKMTDDSILIPFGRPSEVGSSLVDALACQIEKQGVFTRKRLKTKARKARKKYLKKLNIAPAEGNLPKNWLSDDFLEEKAFPHLFPSGKFF